VVAESATDQTKVWRYVPSVAAARFWSVGPPSASWNAPDDTAPVGQNRKTATKRKNGRTPR
jgi:hypothetical protein